jgi:hypothetical protein
MDEQKKKTEEEKDKKRIEDSSIKPQSEKGTYLVAMELTATYTQLITSENRRNAEEVADVACQKADFKRGLLDVTEIKTGTVQKGIMKKIGAQIVFFPEQVK